jgi:hypothetical protein
LFGVNMLVVGENKGEWDQLKWGEEALSVCTCVSSPQWLLSTRVPHRELQPNNNCCKCNRD